MFRPERYEGWTQLSPFYATSENRDHYGYGAGRRICPGMHFAERSLFLGMSKLLRAFDFRPARDKDGNKVEVDVDAETGHDQGDRWVSQGIPKEFPCDIKPRSEARRTTIMKEF